MKKFTALFTGIFFPSYSSVAQLPTVRGSVIDQNENKPIKNAVILLLIPKDSVLYQFTRSNGEGKNVLKDVKPGKSI